MPVCLYTLMHFAPEAPYADVETTPHPEKPDLRIQTADWTLNGKFLRRGFGQRTLGPSGPISGWTIGFPSRKLAQTIEP